MISEEAIRVVDAYAGSDDLTDAAFDSPTTDVIGKSPKSWVNVRSITFKAYGPASDPASLLYALQNGTIPAGTSEVVYDDEDWSLTPADEQQDPGPYMADFVEAAHAAGYKAVLAPAIDLTTAMACNKPTQPAWENYLYNCDIPKLAAQAGADVFDIQAQRFENDTSEGTGCSCYAWVVGRADAEAKAVDAGIEVLAGLSSDQDGVASSPQILYTDTVDTDSAVSGYWLNVAQQSSYCPDCVAGGDPQVLVGYLQLLDK